MAKTSAAPASGTPDALRTVLGVINYVAPTGERPRYYAVDYSRDNLKIDARPMRVTDLRGTNASLDAEGFTLAPHKSAIKNFRDDEEVRRTYATEIEQLIQEMTGATKVLLSAGGILRFGESSSEYGTRVNTRPARFVHVDYTEGAVPGLLQAQLDAAGFTPRPGQRYQGFNVWRVISEPPQDIPLALCDLRTLSSDDLMPADAVFDAPGRPEFSFEGYVVKYNPHHRWCFFSDMTRDEVLVFRNYNSDQSWPTPVPHVAFDDPTCRKGVPTRASIETRAFAFFD
jgi:hypothetical protein